MKFDVFRMAFYSGMKIAYDYHRMATEDMLSRQTEFFKKYARHCLKCRLLFINGGVYATWKRNGPDGYGPDAGKRALDCKGIIKNRIGKVVRHGNGYAHVA
jgi:hypothetical protein